MKGKTCEWSCKSKGGQKTQEISQPWNCAGKKKQQCKELFLGGFGGCCVRQGQSRWTASQYVLALT